MNKAEKALERKLAKLCRKFYEDAQAIFDDSAMNDELYDGEVCQAAVCAQGYAEDAANALNV